MLEHHCMRIRTFLCCFTLLLFAYACRKSTSNNTAVSILQTFVIDESRYAFLNSPQDLLPWQDGYFIINREGEILIYDDSMQYLSTSTVLDDAVYDSTIAIIKAHTGIAINEDTTQLDVLSQFGGKISAKRLYQPPGASFVYLVYGVQGIAKRHTEEHGMVNGIVGFYSIAQWVPQTNQLTNIRYIPFSPLDSMGFGVNPSNAFLVKGKRLFSNLLVQPFRENFVKVASFSLTDSVVALFDSLHTIARHPGNMVRIYGEEMYTVENFLLSATGEVLYINGASIIDLTRRKTLYRVPCTHCILYDAGYIGDRLYTYILEKDTSGNTLQSYLVSIDDNNVRWPVANEEHLYGTFKNGHWYAMEKKNEKVYLHIIGAG